MEGDVAWSVIDATPDGVLVLDRHGSVVFANAQAEAMFGCGDGGLIGSLVDDLVPQEVRAVHRAHRTRYQAAPTVREMGAGLVLRAVRPDGREFPVEVSLSPLDIGRDSYTVAALRDVTDRIAAEDHLHRVLATLDASDDAVFIFDAESLRYSYVNDGAVRLIGYTRSELLEMTPVHLNPNVTASDYAELVASLLDGPEHTLVRTSTLLTKEGVEVEVEKTFRAAPIGRDDSRWVVALARDIRERLAVQEQLRQSHEALALADDRERIAQGLHDTVIRRLFGMGLQLEGAIAGADAETAKRLAAAVDDLDDTIRELRNAIFAIGRPATSVEE
jgi:PAS domain S-box-containing protein